MATTKIPVELSSTPGIVDNSNATAITIDSSENTTFAGNITSGALSVTSDTSSFIRNSTDNDLKFTFVTNNASDFAQLIMDGKDGGSEKFMIAYGSTHGSTPNMLALKSNDSSAGSVGFFTNSTERARFDVNGRFGIGETAPDTFLHVKGTGSGGQGTVKLEGQSAHLGFTRADGNFRSWIGQYNSTTHGSDTDLNIKTGYVGGSSSTGNIRISADGDTTAAQLYVQGSTGYVGIGTTSPGYPLEVANTATTSIAYQRTGVSAKKWGFDSDNSATYLINLTDNVRAITAYNDGKIGIGTITPGHALDVVGTGKPAIEATCTAGHFAIEASTPYDYVAKFSSTDAGAAIILQDNSSTNHANRINVSGDTMQFVTAATTAVTIDASQNVGIGTGISYNASADNILTIGATNRTSVDNGRYFNFQFKVSGGATGQDLIIQAARNIDGSSEDTESIFQYDTSADAQIFYTNGTEHLRINSSGKVGIGSNNPTHKLVVSENSTGLAANIGNTNSNGFGANIYGGNGTNYAFRVEDYDGNERFRITGAGNVGIGVTNPGYKLAVSSKLTVGDAPAVGLSGNTIHVRENSNSGIHFPIVIGGGTHSAGAAFGLAFDPEGYGNRNKIAILAEGTGAGYSRGRLHFAIDANNNTDQAALADSKMCITESGNIGIGAQVDNPSGTLDIRGGRAGIISTDSSWGQFRVANSTVNEVGITVMNGCTASEYLSDGAPTSSNKFIMGISPYGSGTDTWGIGHGALGDSVMHIDASGNFGFGPNTDNPLTYFEISKTRPNVNAPADYELKLTLNTYGYVGSNYKLGMIQFVGGDTASAQDNFYAGISARAVNGANHQEDGALQFHVRSDQDTETLAVELNGEHNPSSQIAGSGSVRNGMLFKWQGIAIDRSWGNYPGIAVMNESDYSSSSSTQAEFRVHGTNGSQDSYPSSSGSDFSVNFRVDGSYLTGSDKRRKKNITTIDNALSTVKQLTGKKFQVINRADEVQETNSKNGYKFGLIAQDVEDIIPEATKYYKDEDDGTEGWNSSYSIDYPSLTALLINAIKEQDTTIQALEARIKALEDK